MTVTLKITDEERRQLLEEARREIVQDILKHDKDALELLSIAEVCGILDCDRKTLDGLGIPRVTLIGGRLYRYLRADVAAWIAARRAYRI